MYIGIGKLAKVLQLATVVETHTANFKVVDPSNTLPLIQTGMNQVVKSLTSQRFVNPVEEQMKLKQLSDQLNKFLLKIEHTPTANDVQNIHAFDELLDVANELKAVL